MGFEGGACKVAHRLDVGSRVLEASRSRVTPESRPESWGQGGSPHLGKARVEQVGRKQDTGRVLTSGGLPGIKGMGRLGAGRELWRDEVGCCPPDGLAALATSDLVAYCTPTSLLALGFRSPTIKVWQVALLLVAPGERLSAGFLSRGAHTPRFLPFPHSPGHRPSDLQALPTPASVPSPAVSLSPLPSLR